MKKLIFISLVLILFFPFIFIRTANDCTWYAYLLRVPLPATMVLVFWINYKLIIPRFSRHNSTRRLILENAILIFSGIMVNAFFHAKEFECFKHPHHKEAIHHRPSCANGQDYTPPLPHKPHHGDKQHFISRKENFILVTSVTDFIYYLLSIFVAYSILATRRVEELHRQQEETEAARYEAELRALRNQVSPHFLLNTLNNIYSLSLMNNGRVSNAVLQLSHLLRHLLYESQGQRVLLRQEADFIRSYVTLMQMRLTDNITVTTNLDIDPDTATEVAPLIFVSLLENAFKHGTTPTCPCQITISLYEDNGIHFRIVNSLHPKTQNDRSGHGIGLDLVRKRLNLYYPEQYVWKYGAEGEDWVSDLYINPKGAIPQA